MSENNIDPNEIDEKKQAFFKCYERAINAWEEKYPGVMPPVQQDKDGNWRWINRKARRKLKN